MTGRHDRGFSTGSSGIADPSLLEGFQVLWSHEEGETGSGAARGGGLSILFWLNALRCWSVCSERRLDILSETGQDLVELVLQLQYSFCFRHALLWSYCEKIVKLAFI